VGSAAPSRFGNLLRRHRAATGLTQHELAERSGLSTRGVQDLERGIRRSPHPDTTRRLAEALKLRDADRAELLRAALAGTASDGSSGTERPVPVLPVPLTSFVGRETELAEIQRLLSSTRLLSLMGTGGVGKSRLALEVAAMTAAGYPDGVWFVELASVEEERLVAPTVLAALGLREVPNQPALDTLVAHVRGWTALLVIDNCEHLLGPSARLVDAIVHAGPGLRVLATSRELLGTTGEMAWRVPSLPVPRDDGSLVPDNLVTYASVRLFEDRARLVRSDFSITPANARSVLQICRRLDGIPLALELAAAWVRVLTTDEIASCLDDMFRILIGGRRIAPRRQQTLRASLDWSHGLLSRDEQDLFRRLAIFAGGWTLDAAEAVCTGEPITKDDVLNLLTSLVDKSLVIAEERPQQRGHMWYRMLEPVRQYALERLNASGEADGFGRKHTGYYLMLAEPGELRWRGPQDVEWLARMDSESDNLRVVLRRTLEQRDGTSNLLLCVRLVRFWEMRGSLEEGLRWLEEGLAQAAAVAPELRIRALGRAAHVAILATSFQRLGVLVDLWLTAARELRDQQEESHANWYRAGYLIAAQGDVEGAIRLGEDCLTFERTRPHTCDFPATTVMMNLAWLLLRRGDAQRARDLFAEVVARATSDGETIQEAMGLAGQGFIAHMDGDFAEALRLVRHALMLVHTLGHRLFVGFFLDVLAVIAAAQSQTERAGFLFGATEAVVEAMQLPRNLWVHNLGPIHDRAVGTMRIGPDAHRFLAAWELGRRQFLDEAIRYALAEDEPEFVSPTTQNSRPRSAGGEGIKQRSGRPRLAPETDR
jgi:predicted ATPase/DNA-binding XRE family transcriptional regulator